MRAPRFLRAWTAVVITALAIALAGPAAAIALQPGTSVHGIVTDAVTGAPIAGAIVFGGPTGEGLTDQLAVTGADGRYEIALPAGTYDLSCYASDRYSQDSSVGVVANPASPAVSDFALTPYKLAFRGTLTDAATGSPLTIASVRAESSDPAMPFSAWAYPDATGDYEVWAPAGTYDLTFAATGYARSTVAAAEFDGTTTVVFDRALQLLGTAVFGTVTDAGTAGPLSGASVVLSWSDAGGSHEAWASTDHDGGYSFEMPAGAYRVHAAAWPYVPSAEVDVSYDGTSSVRQDFSLEPAPRANITGTVTADPGGAAADDAQVCLAGVTSGGGSFEATTSTDASGRYAFATPPAGTYSIVASAPGFWTASAADLSFDGFTPVTTALALDASSRAFFAEVSDARTGAPIASALVEYAKLDAGVYRSEGSTTTGSDGSYVVRLTPGTWQLRISASGHTARTISAIAPPSDGSSLNDTKLDPLGPELAAIEGTDRYDTSIRTSRAAFPTTGTCSAVVLATGALYPDALSAAGLAGAADCPVLLVAGTAPSRALTTEIARLTQGQTSRRIYIIGGTGAVSASMETSLKRTYGTAAVKRLAGATRYTTAEAVAGELFKVLKAKGQPAPTSAMVVSGADFPDALLAGPIAYMRHTPILLVGSVDAALRATLTGNGIKTVSIIGSKASVTASVETALKSALGSANVSRPCAATDRYAQSVAVAGWATSSLGFSWEKPGLATGTNFPDALGASALLGSRGGVLLLTPPTALDSRVAAALTGHKSSVAEVTFFGGTGAVSQKVRDATLNALK